MIKPVKIAEVKEYLAKEFKDFDIKDRYDYALDAQSFKLTRNAMRYVMKITEEFFVDKTVREVRESLRDCELADAIRGNDEMVLLTGRGIKFLKD